MTEEEGKKFVKLVKESNKEITAEDLEIAKKKVDKEYRKKLGKEKYRVWKSIDSEEEVEKLIKEIGKERYVELLDEIFKSETEEMKKELEKLKKQSKN